MRRYAEWLRGLPGQPVFAAHPLAFDGAWIDYYLRRFLGIRLLKGPWTGERLFHTAGLCLQAFAAGRTGWDFAACRTEGYPPERSEERRVGKECVGPCRSRGSPYH